MIRDITIKPALNGFICKVGCQTLVFESIAKLQEELQCYLCDPKGTEDRFTKTALNASHLIGMVQEDGQCECANPVPAPTSPADCAIPKRDPDMKYPEPGLRRSRIA